MKKVILFFVAAVVIIALIFGGVKFNEARLEMVSEKASSALLADSEISQYFEYNVYGTAIDFRGKDSAIIVDLYFKNITSSELRQMEASEGIAFCKMVNKKTRSVLADLGYTDLRCMYIYINPSDTFELIGADTDCFVLYYNPVDHTVEIYTYRNSDFYVVWEEEVSW